MDEILKKIRKQILEQSIRITQHAQTEMDDEEITLDEVFTAIGI